MPFLKVRPSLKNSWLDPPHKEDPSDTVKIWSSEAKFPTKTRVVPVDSNIRAPKRIPHFSVIDESLSKFLLAPAFSSAILDHDAFNLSSSDVSASPHTTIDVLLRSAQLDNYLQDEYLDIILDVLPKLMDTLRVRGDDFVAEATSHVDLLRKVTTFAAETNQRSGQSILAALTSNKLALRDSVLNRFTAHPSSRAVVRGSSFLSHNLFGPLPESFKSSLRLAGSEGKRLTSKSGASTSASTSYNRPYNRTAKRSAPSSSARYGNKRRRGRGGAGTSSGRKNQFFRPPNQKKS